MLKKNKIHSIMLCHYKLSIRGLKELMKNFWRNLWRNFLKNVVRIF